VQAFLYPGKEQNQGPDGQHLNQAAIFRHVILGKSLLSKLLCELNEIMTQNTHHRTWQA
jgi:hypothetical protein